VTRRDPDLALALATEDLSARGRRQLLSESEEALLEQALERDETLRVAHRVGLDLDRVTAVRVGDEALIARAAEAALGRVAASGLGVPHLESTEPERGRHSPSLSPTRRRRIAVLAAAALVCATGMAAAMFAGVVPARFFASRTHASTPVTSATKAALPRNAAPSVSRPEAPTPAPSAPQMEPPIQIEETTPERTDPSTIAARPKHVAPSDATAPALFKSANAARRDGDFATAKRTYSELIDRFPSSDEAGLARVSLGKLLLASGDPSDAERQFGQYLKGAPGQLAEEALVNRAESFQKMGRTKAERTTWQRLLAEYPNSVYAAEASRRLVALSSPTVTPAP
jgi:TolA-binding protein